MANQDMDVVNQSVVVTAIDDFRVDVVNQSIVVLAIDDYRLDAVNQAVVVTHIDGLQTDRVYLMAVVLTALATGGGGSPIQGGRQDLIRLQGFANHPKVPRA